MKQAPISQQKVSTAQSETDELIGTEILGYTLKKRIGKGGFAKVYYVSKATPEINLTSERALKVITFPTGEEYLKTLREKDNDKGATNQYFKDKLDKYADEIKFMKELSSKGIRQIVQYYDHDVVPGKDIVEGITFKQYTLLIMMEFLTDFKDYSKKRPLSVADVIHLGKDVLTALDICHQKGIMHRDIKRNNILVDNKDRNEITFKLADFGISTRLGETHTPVLQEVGTKMYLPPEVLRKEQSYDQTCDLYSLGILLYILLNGQKIPFQTIQTTEDREVAIEKRKDDQRPTLPSQAPKALGNLILKAIKPNRKQRFQSAHEFLKELEKVEKYLSSYELNHELRVSDSTPPSNLFKFKFMSLFLVFILLGLLLSPQSPLFTGHKTVSIGGVTYKEEWLLGKSKDKGTMTYPNGDVYKGEVKEGVPHGKGKITYASGSVYEGEFKEGVPHGEGKLTYADGSVYEGEFREGNRHGTGKLTYTDGSVYEGEYKEEKPHGTGKYTHTDGSVYEGEFREGRIHGKGKKTLLDGTVNEGEFVYNENTGMVNLTDAAGNIIVEGIFTYAE